MGYHSCFFKGKSFLTHPYYNECKKAVTRSEDPSRLWGRLFKFTLAIYFPFSASRMMEYINGQEREKRGKKGEIGGFLHP